MSIPRAWCGAALPTAPHKGHPQDTPESRGICSQCASVLRDDLGVSLDRFESESGVPVVVVTGDVRIVDANPAAVDMLGGDADVLIGHLGGEVFGCENAELPGGCGATPRCPECDVRRVVSSTWESGEPQVRIPAALRVTSHTRPTRVKFLISTAKVGDNVLLRIDSPRTGERPA